MTDRLQAFVFVPDYTVKAITDVLYVRITRTTYMRAIKASLMASRKQSGHTGLTTKHIDSFFNFYLLLWVIKYGPKSLICPLGKSMILLLVPWCNT